jgi:RNA polymerase sigma-B factor
VVVSLRPPVANPALCGFVAFVRGQYDYGHGRTAWQQLRLDARRLPAMTRTASPALTTAPAVATVWLTMPPPALPPPPAPPSLGREWNCAADVKRPPLRLPHPDALLDQLRRLPAGDAGRAAERSALIDWYLPLAAQLARRFAGRGEPLADLTQVAVVGLIGAVDRFDAGRGVPFAAYATPTILGCIKRHFRDTTWNVRVPRRLQELKAQVGTATEDLAHVLHRSPTTAELAARLGIGPQDVQAARLCANAYRPVSFDQPLDGPGLVDLLGDRDPRIDAVDWHVVLGERLAGLPVRDRRIIGLQFFGNMTQAQIAVELGVSQMQVSRLLRGSFEKLREWMDAEA